MANKSEFSEGWPVLTAAAVGVGLGLSPLPFYTVGVFIPPLMQEFAPMGWSVGDILNALAIYTFGAFAAAPLVGMVAEKFGARKVTLISIITFGLSMMSLALNNGSKPLYIFLWFLLAFAGAGTLPVTFTRPVANWFVKNRGMALGIALIATGVFGALAKFYAQFIVSNEAFHIIGNSGWRSAYVMLGCLPLAIALPMAWLGLRDVDDVSAKDANITKFKYPILAVSMIGTLILVTLVIKQVTPLVGAHGLRLEYFMAYVFCAMVLIPVSLMLLLDIKKAPPQVEKGTVVVLPGLTLMEAFKTWRFWVLAISFVPISYSVGAIIPNIERVLTFNGISMDEAVGLATLTGLAVLSGRIIGGYLIDRFWAPGVAFAFLASPAIALWMLAQPGVDATTATIAILMIGFGAGVEYDFMAFMISKYFGMKSYSAIYGAIYGFFALGAGLGPSIMTDIADGRGIHFLGANLGILPGHDWHFTLVSAAIVLFVSTIPLLFLGKYQYDFEDHKKKKTAETEVAAE
ncbi:MFS transporter [Hirschia litorea]|uniref:MFS transporter n=1 Tax=Hirschia litorea TaxID=1199156 RepID=A0ABW2IH28_9PROT